MSWIYLVIRSSSAAVQLSNASYSTQSPSGLYSKSYLSELKASTPSTPSFKQQVSDGSIDMGSDMSMVYEHTNDSLASMFVCSIARVWPLTAGSKVEAFADIPSEASIKAAKEKRERLRQLGVTTADSSSDDFISLSLVTQDLSRQTQGPHPESRLQREEDDLGEGDDGNHRTK
jgi:GC-rich sequence DNA-binding factor